MAKDGAKFKTYGNVFDNHAERVINQLISQGHFEKLKSPLSVGKEANVFTAEREDGSFVVVKIYRLETCDFNRMFEYIKGDPRYSGLKPSKRRIIFTWTQREFRNLLKARQAGVRAPTPYTFIDNVLVEELIGEPALKLKDVKPADPEAFCALVVEEMERMVKAGMVHGDLSAFNILNDDEKPVLIDFSQATTYQNPNALRYLERDCKNIAIFFQKRGVEIDGKALYDKLRAKLPKE